MNVMPMRDEKYKDIELKPTKEQVGKLTVEQTNRLYREPALIILKKNRITLRNLQKIKNPMLMSSKIT